MKRSSLLKKLSAFIFVIILSNVSLAGQETRNGGDGFEINGAYIVWDALEYGNAMYPVSLSSFSIVKSQLAKLEKSLPHTAKYLRSFFFENSLMWWLVQPKLKDISNNASTNLQLTYKSKKLIHVQVAINQEEGLVQINETIWKKLDEQSKAFLLVHEVLWTALEYKTRDETAIYALTGILMNPYLDQLSAKNLANKLKKWAPENSEFKTQLNKDIQIKEVHGEEYPEAFSYKDCTIKYWQTADTCQFLFEVYDGYIWHYKLDSKFPISLLETGIGSYQKILEEYKAAKVCPATSRLISE